MTNMERNTTQLGLFEQHEDDVEAQDDVEARIQALLARRRAMNVSGQAGEDIEKIRAAFTASATAEA